MRQPIREPLDVVAKRFPVRGTAPVRLDEEVTAEVAERLLGRVHEVPLPNGAKVFFQRESRLVNQPVSFAVGRMIGHPIRIMGDAIVVPPPIPPPL